MKTTPPQEKINFNDAIINMPDRDMALRKRMDDLNSSRTELKLRFHSIKSLHICFRKQYNEMKSLLFKHEGKELDFLDEEAYNSARNKLIDPLTRLIEVRSAIGDSEQLSSEQIEEQEELYFEIEPILLNWIKLVTLREEFVTQEEITDKRIAKLLKVIGK